MYFVVFWDEWCATIPASWLILKSQVFKWPPKNKNATNESKKGTKPQEKWITVRYSKLLGPFDTFEEVREVENNTLDISTNDEKTLAEVTKKKNTEVSQKRAIQKPYCFLSSSSNSSSKEEEESQTKTKAIEKKSSQHSMNQTTNKNLIDETAENSCNNKPPTNYKSLNAGEFCHMSIKIWNENDCTKEQIFEKDEPLFSGDLPHFIQKDISLELQADILTHEDLSCITETKSKSKASEKPTIKNIVVTNIPLPVGILRNKKNGNNQSWNSENNIQKL